jgi:hypothetical protein
MNNSPAIYPETIKIRVVIIFNKKLKQGVDRVNIQKERIFKKLKDATAAFDHYWCQIKVIPSTHYFNDT